MHCKACCGHRSAAHPTELLCWLVALRFTWQELWLFILGRQLDKPSPSLFRELSILKLSLDFRSAQLWHFGRSEQGGSRGHLGASALSDTHLVQLHILQQRGRI